MSGCCFPVTFQASQPPIQLKRDKGLVFMNLALKPDLQRFVETQLNTGRFRSAEEVVQAGLELLRDRQQQLDHVREQLSEGLEQARRGELIDGEEAFDQI